MTSPGSMTTFQEYQQAFVNALLGAMTADTGPSAQLRAVMDALPYYGDQNFRSAHRGTLCTQLRVRMADHAIAPQPGDSGFGYYTSYSYKGPYSGYADAFCHGAAATAASGAVAAEARAANPALTPGWWQDYADDSGHQ
jgi:hypothetical protein